MGNALESLFVSKKNYLEFLKTIEKNLSDESKLQEAISAIYEKVEEGIKDLSIQNNDQMNILTIVVSADFFSPKNVFIAYVHLIKQDTGNVVIKY